MEVITLQSGSYPQHLKNRIDGKSGHISSEDAAQLSDKRQASQLQRVCLGHLSGQNNSPEVAPATHRERHGDRFTIFCADRDGVTQVPKRSVRRQVLLASRLHRPITKRGPISIRLQQNNGCYSGPGWQDSCLSSQFFAATTILSDVGWPLASLCMEFRITVAMQHRLVAFQERIPGIFLAHFSIIPFLEFIMPLVINGNAKSLLTSHGVEVGLVALIQKILH